MCPLNLSADVTLNSPADVLWDEDIGWTDADGVGSNATLLSSGAIAITSDGALAVFPDVTKVRLIDLSNNNVTTLAGSWETGTSDGTGTSATASTRWCRPRGARPCSAPKRVGLRRSACSRGWWS